MCAVLASFYMIAKRGGPAELDRGHDAALHATDMTVMENAIGMTMATEDVRHLQLGAHAPGSGGRHNHKGQAIERALRPCDRARRHMDVARRR